MKPYYFTFGYSQSLRNCYVKIEAENMQEARQKMEKEYGSLWAFSYTEDDYPTSIKRWELTEVPFGTPNTRIMDD